MLRAVLILAACAFAEGEVIDSAQADTVIARDSIQARTYYPSKETQAAALSSVPLFASPAGHDQAHYLRQAGYHWLMALGLGATGTAIGYFSDWESPNAGIATGFYIGAFILQVRVPIDLILAGGTKK